MNYTSVLTELAVFIVLPVMTVLIVSIVLTVETESPKKYFWLTDLPKSILCYWPTKWIQETQAHLKGMQIVHFRTVRKKHCE